MCGFHRKWTTRRRTRSREREVMTTAVLERPTTEDLTPAQRRTLDSATLHPVLTGKTVVRAEDPSDVVQLATARKLVDLGLLVALEDNKFQHPLFLEPATHDHVLPKRPLNAQQQRTKRRNRNKRRVARAQRRINRHK